MGVVAVVAVLALVILAMPGGNGEQPSGLALNPDDREITKRRGDLDLDGIRFLVIRYGLHYQVLFNYLDGHVSVGVKSHSDVIAITNKILDHWGLPA